MIINSPYVSGSLTVSCNINVCGTINGTANICTSTLFASTRVCSPNLCATTTICGPAFVGGTMSGTTLYGSTAACAPTVFGTTAVCSPTIFASTVACAPTVFGTTAVCAPTVFGTTAVCAPTVFGTTVVCGGSVCTTGNICAAGSITGSAILSTGRITAQTLVVSTISSSVTFSSGSNIFGNSTANTQTMTGSVNITGSLTVTTTVPELTVGATGVTLGNVITDTHNVTGSLRITGSLNIVGGTTGNTIYGSTTVCAPNLCATTTICGPAFIGGTISGTTGTFSDNVTLTRTSIMASYIVNAQGSCAVSVGAQYALQDGGNTVAWLRRNRDGSCTTELTNMDGNLLIKTGASVCTRITIASTGEACFACQICSPSFIGGTVTGTTLYGSTAICGGAITGTTAVLTNTLKVGQCNNGEMFITIGECRTASGFAYIDFIGDTTYTDYGLRLIRGNAGANSTSQLVHRGTGDLQINTDDAASIQLRTCATDRVRITAAGCVGIGTGNPCTTLDVRGDVVLIKSTTVSAAIGGPILSLGDTTSEVGMTGGISFTENLSSSHTGVTMGIYYDGINNKMHIVGACATTVVGCSMICAPKHITILRDSGCVGIGTTDPGANLHVAGRIRTSNTQTSGAADASGIIQFGDNNVGLFRGAANSLAAGNLLNIAANDGIVFTVQSGCQLATQCERMRIASGGNVGIGTCNPQKLFELRTGGTSTTPSQIFGGGITQAIVGVEPMITFSTNVCPAAGSATATELARAGIGFTYVSAALPSEFSIGIQCTNVCNSNFRFFNGTERMRITNAGCVGIGCNSPGAALHIYSPDGQFRVNGDGRAQMILATSAKTWQFETSCGAGNVAAGGIGLVEGGVGTSFQIYPGGTSCFRNTVCAPEIRFCGGNAAINNYEVGTWTPHYNVAGSCTGVTYYTRFGYYRRIGDMVTIWGGTRVCSNGSGTGEVTISGLPLTVNCIAAYTHPVGAFSKVDSGNCKVYSLLASSTTLFFREQTATGDITASDTCFPDGTSLIWTMTYIV